MKRLISRVAWLVAMCMMVSFAQAEMFRFDDGLVKLGKVYDVPDYCSALGTFRAPSSGSLLQQGCTSLIIEGLEREEAGWGPNGQQFIWQVQAGKDYTVKSDFVMQGGKVQFQMQSEIGLSVTDLQPAEGSMVSPSTNYNGEILIYFSVKVRVGGATLKCGNTFVPLQAQTPTGNMVVVSVRDALRSLIRQGVTSEDGGTPFTITITGLESSDGVPYNGTGELVLDFVSAPKEAALISTNINDVGDLQSYYVPGDPNGILTFTFDADLATSGIYLQLAVGNPEISIYYEETIDAKVDGHTATADLTGVLRNLKQYTNVQGSKKVGVSLLNVRDRQGFYAEGQGEGSLGSYNYQMNYHYIEPVDIASEFDPSSGSSIMGVEEIEIWFNHSDMITYDGVNFSPTQGDVIVVPNSELDIDVNGTETTIKVKVPQDLHSSCVVTLENLQAKDGHNHSHQIRAQYGMFVADLVSPIAEGQSIASTGTQDFVVSCNENPTYLRYDFYSHVTAEHPDGWTYGEKFTKSGSTWRAPNPDITCYTDFTPYMVVSAYNSVADYNDGSDPVGRATFTFVGTTVPFEFSTYALQSITPQGGYTIEQPFAAFCVTAAYDGLVSIDQKKTGIVGADGTITPMAKLERINVTDEDPAGYANTWALYPGDAALKGADKVTVQIVAIDQDGKLIEGNTGKLEQSVTQVEYNVDHSSDPAEGDYTFTDGLVELGVTYQVPDMAKVKAYLVAPSTGVLMQRGCPSIQIAGLEPEMAGWHDTYGMQQMWRVEAGVRYTVQTDFVMQGGPCMFEMQTAENFKLEGVTPAAGSEVASNVNYNGDIIFDFSYSVKCGGAQLVAGDTSVTLVPEIVNGSTIVVNVRQAIRTLISTGVLAEEGGTPFTVNLTGVTTSDGSILYAGTGQVSVDYVSAPKVAMLISDNVAEVGKLKSYYAPGNPEGMLVFVFDSELANDGRTALSLGIGNRENDPYYYEEITAQVDGATITVDLCGKLRDLNVYAQAQGSDVVEVKLYNVRDSHGQFAEGDGPGNVGSYGYTLIYDYIEPVDIVSEFNPPSGSSLSGVEEIEIWFNHSDMITYDGVKFAVEGGDDIIVPNADINITVANNETTMLVPVPALNGGVTVTLNNMQSLDGHDHTKQVMAQYGMVVVTLIAPIHDGQSLASTGDADFVVTCNTNVGYMRYDFYNRITDDSPDGWCYGTAFSSGANGTWVAPNFNFTCYTDFTPRMVVTLYTDEESYYKGEQAVGSTTFTFVGTTRPFAYSDFEFVSITPADGTMLEGPFADFCFTLAFDGMVRLDPERTSIMMGFGATRPFAKIEGGTDEEMGYSSTWRLYPGDDFMSEVTDILFSVVAYDQDGNMVRGNMGGDEWDYLMFSYGVASEAALKAVNVTPASGTVLAQIDKFEVAAAGYAVSRNWNYLEEMPQLTTTTGDVVYTFTDADIHYPIVTGEITSAVLTLATPITDEGEYVLVLPQGFFVVGQEFETYLSMGYTGTYKVSVDGIWSAVVDAAESYEVYTPLGVKVMSTTDANELKKLRPGLYLVNGKKVKI